MRASAPAGRFWKKDRAEILHRRPDNSSWIQARRVAVEIVGAHHHHVVGHRHLVHGGVHHHHPLAGAGAHPDEHSVGGSVATLYQQLLGCVVHRPAVLGYHHVVAGAGHEAGPAVDNPGPHRGAAPVGVEHPQRRGRRVHAMAGQLVHHDRRLHLHLCPGVDVQHVATAAALEVMLARHRDPVR